VASDIADAAARGIAVRESVTTMPYLKVRRRWEESPSFVESKTFFYATDEAEAYANADSEPRGADGWIEEHPFSTTVSDTTRAVLKALAAIGGGDLHLKEGFVQHAGAPFSIIAVATLPDRWPKDTPLLNCRTFLGALDACNQPVVECGVDAITIRDRLAENPIVMDIAYDDASELQSPISLPDVPYDHPAVECHLSTEDYRRIVKTVRALGSGQFTLDVQADAVVLTSTDPRCPQRSGAYQWTVLNVRRHDPSFAQASHFGMRQIELLPTGGYTVLLGNWNYAVWVHDSLPIWFHVARSISVG
jgi:hypothetical protein